MVRFFFFFFRDINFDVEFEVYNYNIIIVDNFDYFMDRIK